MKVFLVDSQQDLDQTFIKDLRLSKRTFNALCRKGVFTVGKLKELIHNNKLEKINFIGQKCIDEVSNALDEFYKEASNPVSNAKTSETTLSLSKSIAKNNISVENPLLHKMEIGDIDSASVEILCLHASTKGALIKNGVNTIGDLKLATDKKLKSFNLIGPKVLIDIRKALKSVVDTPDKYIPKKNIVDKWIPSQANNAIAPWAEITQSYFESEKDNYTYVLLSRFGFKPKKLEEIASELNITRERIRQIQEAATARFLKYVRFAGTMQLFRRIHEILLEYGENISLEKFKGQLRKENLLGEFSPSLMSNRIPIIDPFETLICWLNLLSDSKHTQPPVEFPVDIKTLINSDSLTIKDSEKLRNILPRLIRKIKRKVHFTGGIDIKEASKILSEDEGATELVLRKINLMKIDEYWYSLKTYDTESDTSKIPLWTAGMKMLAVKTDINLDTFYDGLRRYANRFYPSIAPINVVSHALKLLGFEINDQQIVSTEQSHKNILSQSEKSLVLAISNNDGVASFLEIAEEFFLQNLSLPAVSVTLKRSPIAEKVEEGFYKLRGTEISWQQIDAAKRRQKRYSQDEKISHGLDGIVRIRLTVNIYAYLAGVVGSYGIKGMTGSWSVIYNNESFGEAKMDETYLWGLPKIFKKLDVRLGDRIELAFNTWNRTLSVEKVSNGIT